MAALLAAHGSAIRAQDGAQQLLVGKWRHIALVRVIDGQTLAPQPFDGTTVSEFKEDGTWALTSPQNRSAGTYRWVGEGAIEMTTLESGLAIQVGLVSTRQVRVDASRLNIITVQTAQEAARFLPPPRPGVRRPGEITVTSIFSRVVGE